MLESLYSKYQEFGPVKKKYQEIRDVLEKVLVSNEPSSVEVAGFRVIKEVKYKEMPLKITLTVNSPEKFEFFSADKKLLKLANLNINVGIETNDSEIGSNQDVPPTSHIIADQTKTHATSVSLSQAHTIIENLEGITDLLI